MVTNERENKKIRKRKEVAGRKFPMNKRVEEHILDKADSKFNLLHQIKDMPYYKRSEPSRNDPRARNFIETHTDVTSSGRIVPGQLILFKYFEPKTKEELEYYDASPCTIFFNVINTKEGKRVLGFNIHYYPPHMRFLIMNRIFEIYKPILTKYFEKGNMKEIDAFDYKYLISSLENAGLGFGVRMYIPELINEVRKIPPQLWQVAVFTEGWFKKQTRAAIMKYWTRWKNKNNKSKVSKTSKNSKKN